ncbi:SH3 domain-binding glutamic acid-rich-like protein 3 [Lepisosteus oculatus]|uniref:SH3 domain-binding glutamic acid-rich-like protein 3 n=1 Tax=Lepisosteus oculatus TaxID=7918 RepID=UPI0003EAB7DD|nr:PREDICTED: SH3 domain-binding glutamic acid-rich-like protein 3 [Lepisosteus oculatus]
MALTIYYSSVSGSREVKQQQTEIFQYLDSMKMKYKALDIAVSNDIKQEMRQKTGNPTAMPPQIFNGEVYCGDYAIFFQALEDRKADEFFKLRSS